MSADVDAARRADGWFTSSFSNGGNECVEVRFDGDDVLVADSKQHGRGPEIRFARAAWDAFVAAVVGGGAPAGGDLAVVPGADGGRALVASTGVRLEFTAREWAAFVAGARNGEFSLVNA
ncbi:DUF397 domain-containing protein [Pseudonocardia sp. CA-107938]|uniref:DUF397 domain-containing protein n=1 Tax=Pseudonocardia sp. CA-107938 TaxID=3240021 RepID=UPI003D91FAEE